MSLNQSFHLNLDKLLTGPDEAARKPQKMKHKFIKELNHKFFNSHKESLNRPQQIITRRRPIDTTCQEGTSSITKQLSTINSGTDFTRGFNVIRGEWKDNKMNGNFLIEYNNGSVFEGVFQNDLKIHGKMIYKTAKCSYEGAFFGEKFSGFGKLSYEGGRSIEGQWDSCQIVGNATITYPNKDVYYGPVDENLYKHGEGHLFLQNDFKYVGMFRRGSITGFGTYYKGSEIIKAGLWNKGNLLREIENDQLNMMGPHYFMNNCSKEISDVCLGKLSAKIQELKAQKNQRTETDVEELNESLLSIPEMF